jgi:cysteine synthase A
VLWIDQPFAPTGRGFWAKLEGNNPGGIKDRAALHMVAAARQRGRLRPGARIVESSSGTFALGLALAGAVYGHPVTIVADPGLETSMRRMLASYGATVDLVTDPHPVGGWQQARRERVHCILRDQPGAYHPNQYDNPDNIHAYDGLAAELPRPASRCPPAPTGPGTDWEGILTGPGGWIWCATAS